MQKVKEANEPWEVGDHVRLDNGTIARVEAITRIGFNFFRWFLGWERITCSAVKLP